MKDPFVKIKYVCIRFHTGLNREYILLSVSDALLVTVQRLCNISSTVIASVHYAANISCMEWQSHYTRNTQLSWKKNSSILLNTFRSIHTHSHTHTYSTIILKVTVFLIWRSSCKQRVLAGVSEFGLNPN